jgi:hypothetical protein
MRSTAAVVLFSALAIPAIPATPALAQFGVPPMSIQQDKPKLSPEEQAKQDKLDRAYRAAIGSKPDQKATDPWGNVRAAPQTSATHTPAKPQQLPKTLDLKTP